MNDLPRWRELCEWLNRRPSKCAYRAYVPRHLQPLLGPDVTTRIRRLELALVFYATGWGWRLRQDWQKRMVQFEEAEKA